MPITPEQIKKLRKRAGLTQTEAAKLIHVQLNAWQRWEAPEGSDYSRKMSETCLELFCIKIGSPYPPT